MNVGRSLVAALAAGAALLSVSGSASAAGSAKGFGEKGQIILSADRLVPLFSYTNASITNTVNNVDLVTSRSGSGISLLFGRDLSVGDQADVVPNVHTIPRVAFDVSIIDHLTIGAAIAFGFGLGGTYEEELFNNNQVTSRRADLPTSTAIGFAPRVGYVLPLSDLFAFWPRAGIGFYSVSGSLEQQAGGTTVTVRNTDTILSLDLDPQFVLVPVEHFFIHAGPIINVPLSGSRSVTRTQGATTTELSQDASLFHLGISAGLGAYFDVF